ncbi:MAG: translation initiation factor Sui1 [Candidatus Tectomicrobia bacterium]|uniref:Translation initiation factor Sui1 n=1 Tax=Tectimicrobiota bacterium TaxID=2528274 RepID=A0A937W187_UNCTE|nr:translation initiation factor Sui1 [Candidatus Tectomicrobia bacterium]
MSTPIQQDTRTVYSSEHGRMCPACQQPLAACICRQRVTPPVGDGVVRVGRETKGRKGKGVTIITGVPLEPAALQQLATQLKQHCGAGGTLKDGVIELQGDHRDRVIAVLRQRGYQVKRAGG